MLNKLICSIHKKLRLHRHMGSKIVAYVLKDVSYKVILFCIKKPSCNSYYNYLNNLV